MLAALLLNDIKTGHGTSYTVEDRWLRVQDDLTRFKTLEDKEEVVLEAVREVIAAEPELEVVVEAKQVISETGLSPDEISLLRLEIIEIEIIMLAYFTLRREEDDIAAMLVLGML